MKADAVFEGGGVKGIAFIGAIEKFEEAGYVWNRLAGTSAGAIIAALLAAGYTGREVRERLVGFPFQNLEQRLGINRVRVFGPWANIAFRNGIYSMSLLEEWMAEQLQEKGIHTFGDLPPDRLKIIVTDVTQNRMSVLPDDLSMYGLIPEAFPVALSVRMSASIPFLFRPCLLAKNIIVDGGVLSNYPIWLFDGKEPPKWPAFGFRLSGPSAVNQPKKIKGPIDLSTALIRTMVEWHDKRYIEASSAVRTVFIKGIKIPATQFSLSQEEKEELIQLGRDAAHSFLCKWNFETYVFRYCRNPKYPKGRIV